MKTMLLYPVEDKIEVLLKGFLIFDVINRLAEDDVISVED